MAASKWIICQIGAREHYAAARALERLGKLQALVTDAWIPPGLMSAALPARLGQRFHRELAGAEVIGLTAGSLAFEAEQRLRRKSGWELMMARNEWFGRMAGEAIDRRNFPPGSVLFSYSYAAREILRLGRRRGWKTILGQIDPGKREEEVVAELNARRREGSFSWHPAPPDYWENWREECRMADLVAVNSRWSAEAVEASGVPAAKIRIVPLACTPPEAARDFDREYPSEFSAARPLQVLFLGQTILRKGLAELIEAGQLLASEPVNFVIIGSGDLPPEKHPNIEWKGAVPRAEVDGFYRHADVFLFPTHSDGFGLTQLEAQAWKLPIIASRRCGEVVRHRENGLILDEVSAESIAAAIRQCLASPRMLNDWSRASQVGREHSLDALGEALTALEAET